DTDTDTGGWDTDPAPCCEDPDCSCDTDQCVNQPCQADAYCDCQCPSDPDCEPGTCGGDIPLPPAPVISDDPAAQAAMTCPDEQTPVVLYMSNDDSNSQASPILARRMIRDGGVVDPFRVRIHEFLNYYDLSYEQVTDAPARVGMQMRRINSEIGEFALLLYAQGRHRPAEARRPMNLVFSLDTSGSMSGEPVELLKESMRATAASLRAGDVVSIVEWSDVQSVLMDSYEVSGPSDPMLLAIVNNIETGGSTDLHAGLVLAYQLASANFSDQRINRVVLISDGGANTGTTDIDLIAASADDSDGEGIYMVGVGVGASSGYRDDLMDEVTDAGKGAYVFIDSPEEANRMFGDRFVQIMDVAARDVQMQVTLPWYFAIKEFHGEEYSANPAEVDPQHLAPDDTMSYHQIIQVCDPSLPRTTDEITARATFEDPISRVMMSDEMSMPLGDLVTTGAKQLYKADVVVAYAQSLIVIGDLMQADKASEAKALAEAMIDWLQAAESELGDPEISEIRALMQEYVVNLN
ncbi:MAG: VWA domain-containing protein, partial [Myxococcales bacterium]|nr:VWA domain-containing protein [Myxococcales bacterium]